jgi:Fe2+ transport system protein FeoA
MISARLPSDTDTAVGLAHLPRRSRGVVVRHRVDASTAERLSAVGLGVGASFTVLRAGARPTVRVGECRLALGREIAAAVDAVPV